MRTYLQLVQKLHQECGMAGAPPTTVAGHALSSDQQRICEWITDAWLDIQKSRQEWIFRRRSTSFVTINGQGTYTQAECGLTAGTLGKWDLDSFRSYLTAVGTSSEQYMAALSYDEWRDVYLYGTARTTYEQPLFVARVPSTDGLALGPIPRSGYTIVGDYYLAPQILAVDGDIPDLPERHNSLGIVWKAMLDYGYYKLKTEAIQRATSKYAIFLHELETDQLPEVCLVGSL